MRDGRALIGERAEHIAVEDHVFPACEPRLDLRSEVVEAVGGEEQRHHALVDHVQLPVRLLRRRAAREDLADEEADAPAARLMREVDGAPLAAERIRQQLRLGRRSCAVQPFEDDEAARGRHELTAGGGSIPSAARTSRSRRSSSTSRRRSARARE